MNIKESIADALKLKEPNATDWAPGLLGTTAAYLKANPVKLPLLSPVYIPLAFVGLGFFCLLEGVDGVRKNLEFKAKNKRYDYLSNLADNLTEDKYPELNKFLNKHSYYGSELSFSGFLSKLIEKENKEGILFFLDRVKLCSNKNKGQEDEAGNSIVTDLFHSLTYNIKFMKELMNDNILEKFAESRNQSFDIDVAYYISVIPSIIAQREKHSSCSIAIKYLQNFPDNFTYNPKENTKKPAIKM
jgi:hypothetical protein